MSVLLSFGLCCLSISLGHTLGAAAARLRFDLNQAIPVQCMLHVFDDLVHVPVPEDRPKSSGPRCR